MATPDQLDPNTLHDFLTESGELIEGLDRDMVSLEKSSSDPELLNRIFRAVHTTKGSASFLGLDTLTTFAHAAEDALNALRKGEAQVTAEVMDRLLAAVDVLKRQLQELGDGQMPGPGPADLIAALKAIGAGSGAGKNAAPKTTAPPDSDSRPLVVSEAKRDLLPFMAADLSQSLQPLASLLGQVTPDADRARLAESVSKITGELVRSVDFFEIPELCAEMDALDGLARAMGRLDAALFAQALPRALQVIEALQRRAVALTQSRLLRLDTQALLDELSALSRGEALAAAPAPPPDTEADEAAAPAEARGGPAADAGEGKPKTQTEQTIRVDVSRLETLLNLIGELVLQKNRVLALHRRLKAAITDHQLREQFGQVASDLDRVTADLQIGVMKTRMQPLNKIFSRYPRVVRDLGRLTGKQIDLEIIGGETEVDKSVIEALPDPLVHLLRNSADHGIESPEQRVAAGKSPRGTVRLSAQHEGNHVLIQVSDDGKGIDARKIGRKAVERGLVKEEELAALSETDVLQFIFAPGLSTAEQVSNMSGRGVGMDVVRSNIAKVNGMVDVATKLGQGTTVTVRIPLTVAIMPAMMVGVGGELYAVPLSNILEIVRPSEKELASIAGKPVMRLRDRVLPLLDLSQQFQADGAGERTRFAVVAGLGDRRVGLLVDRLIGQQEVVIKPLDGMFDRNGAISGATVREDGGVSLILDLAALLKTVEDTRRQAA